MPITWDEVRHNAIRFSRDWAKAVSEAGEKQTFWNEFFLVFGIKRRSVATFEEPVQKIRGSYGRIDLFWRGKLLVEHKSAGEDLGLAASQAFAYIGDLTASGRADEVPRFVIVSDFARFVLYDLEPDEQRELPLFKGIRYAALDFGLGELHRHVRAFAFLRGEKTMKLDPEDPANQKAYDRMCMLHDELQKGGFAGNDLERLLVRVLFCLFAEDNGIFEPNAFQAYLEEHVRKDGSDLGLHLNQLFDVLNTPPEKRQPGLSEELAAFPYVNGALFADRLGFPIFTSAMRDALMECTHFQWGRISPAVFGSLFQGIMEPAERRQQGAHYTSERDIMKVIRSLFLDELRAEFSAICADASTRQTARLKDFQKKLGEMQLFDPACGCGNFLVLAYRELRQLELELLQKLHGEEQKVLDVRALLELDVDQFYGIEIGEWPCRIAEVALWLMDHQMNLKTSELFGQHFHRLPLRSTPHITCGNALRLDWKQILPPNDHVLVLGNPPFVGHHYQNIDQKSDQSLVMANIKAHGVLDYVANWYVRAAEYIQGTQILASFVSTNSITQGEQAGILWRELIGRYRIKINFAHRTFAWASEARGKAHVHVVIVGFATHDQHPKKILDYELDALNPTVSVAKNISPYLVEGSDQIISNRSTPICDVPQMIWGNKPTDGGHFLFTPEEKNDFLRDEPRAAPFIRRYMGGQDFINSQERYCLWLVSVDPSEIRNLPFVMKRVQAVAEFRRASKAEATRKYAQHPMLFRQIAQPDSDYLAVPEVSSESRHYIPMAFVSKIVICSNTLQVVPDATIYHFGVLTSLMHMSWMRTVCGRLKSDYRYSNSLVYNNYPWPLDATDEQKTRVEDAAKGVLAARDEHPTSTLADLYDPLTMPANLVKAHAALDRAVDRCYRKEPFHSDRERVEYLFALYEKLTAPLAPTAKPAKRRRVKA